MTEQRVTLETAKLANDRGFPISGNHAGFLLNKPDSLNLPTQS